MNRLLTLAAAGAVSAALASIGCENKDKHHHDDSRAQVRPSASNERVAVNGRDASAPVVVAAAREMAASAKAEVGPSKAPGMDDVKGEVTFTAAPAGVVVTYDIKGLTPNGKHGFHIHEKGDLSDPEFKSAGPHFNPGGHKHGGPSGDARHGGDLGNITADDKGVARGEVTATGLTLDESKTGILGRSIVVHEKADDLATDPSGNSGARVGAGVIKAAAASKAPEGEKDANNPAKREN
jgi:Cu-Zn family superoxide dismutase